LIWLARHGFVSLDFLRHIHARDVQLGRTAGFLRDQFVQSTNLFTVPLWLAGLIFLFHAPQGRPFQLLGWMFAIPFALFFFAHGRGYYQAATYPSLFAAGAVWRERWITSLSLGWARLVRGATFAALAVGGVLAAAILLPIAPIGSPRNVGLRFNGELREEIGWPEMVEEIARIRNSLPVPAREGVGILAGNYGEAGAINLYGPAYGLPRAISGINTYWMRGYGNPSPTTLIVVGFSREFVERNFESCGVAGRNTNPYGIKNEESVYHPDIFVCGAPREPWPEFWQKFKYYG